MQEKCSKREFKDSDIEYTHKDKQVMESLMKKNLQPQQNTKPRNRTKNEKG